MKIISDALYAKLEIYAKADRELSTLIRNSNTECFNYGVHQKNRYTELLEMCTNELHQHIDLAFLNGTDLDTDEFISALVQKNMPEQTNILFEFPLDNTFYGFDPIEYDLPPDNLSLHVRAWIDEQLNGDLRDESVEYILAKREELENSND